MVPTTLYEQIFKDLILDILHGKSGGLMNDK